MAVVRNRFPSRTQIVLLSASCVFLVYSWTVFNFFHKLPGWMMFLNPGEIFGILAYTVGSALLESLVVTLFLVMLAALLPARWFRDRLVGQGTILVLVLGFWSVTFQYIYASTAGWETNKMLPWSVMLLISTVIACLLVQRLERFESALNALADRLTVFLYIYIPMGLVGLAVVAVRNL